MVQDSEIRQIFSMGKDVREDCCSLVNAALRNGGKDNVTAVLARLGDLGDCPDFDTTESNPET